MKSMLIRFICRVLVVCMAVAPLQASAGLIATGESAVGGSAAVARVAVAVQLEALGLSAAAAAERVGALSDAEVLRVSGRLEELPAGAFGGIGLGIALVIIFLVWRFGVSDQAKADTKATAKEPAKKQ